MTIDVVEQVKTETQEALDRFLRETLGDLGYTSVVITPAIDHDGEPILRINLHFDYREAPVDSMRFVGLMKAVVDILALTGERRFPQPSYVFDERQKITRAA